jgi:hypothetical protein
MNEGLVDEENNSANNYQLISGDPHMPSSVKTFSAQSLNYAAWGLNIADSFCVAAFFALLSSEKYDAYTFDWGWYASASFLLNFPMSALFNFNLADEVEYMKVACQTGDRIYFVSLAMGFSLTMLTILSAYAIGRDTVDNSAFFDDKSVGFDTTAVGIFLWNMFCTRLVGSKNMLSALLHQCFKPTGKSGVERALDRLALDGQRLPLTYKSRGSEDEDFATEIRNVYSDMPRYNLFEKRLIRLNECCFGKLSYLVTVPAVVMCWGTLALWRAKAETGGEKTSAMLHQNKDFLADTEFLSMLSSLFFYMNSAFNFCHDNIRYYNTTMYQVSSLKHYSVKARFAIYIVSLTSTHVVAYASGEGMKNEAVDLLNGAFPQRTSSFLHGWGQYIAPEFLINTWKKLGPFSSMNFAAGNVVNGRAGTNLANKLNKLCAADSGYLDDLVKRLEKHLAQTDTEQVDAIVALIDGQSKQLSSEVRHLEDAVDEQRVHRGSREFKHNG